MDKLNVAGIMDESIVDGEGIRLAVFLQGCPHHCKGCQNPETWNTDKLSLLMTVDEIMKKYDGNPLLNGITFSGGEPFIQADKLIPLAEKVHRAGGNVWCYTGYTIDELRASNEASELLRHIDVLVDGPYIEKERDLTLKFRGSKNQHIWKNEGGNFKLMIT